MDAELQCVSSVLNLVWSSEASNCGCESKTWPHTSTTNMISKDNRLGSPPISSKISKRFPPGFRNARGAWYLPKFEEKIRK